MANIVVFEDEFLPQEFLKDTLVHFGHELELFPDGSDANLEGLLGVEEAPDCFMLDYNMPVRDGYEIAELLKKDPKYGRFSRTPIIGIGDFPENKQEYLVSFCPKPWRISKLTKAIEDAVKIGEALKS